MARRRRSTDSGGGLFLIVVAVGVYVLWQNLNTPAVHGFLVYCLVIVAITVALLASLWILRLYRDHRRQRALQMADVDTMDPLVFEKYVAKLLRSRGFRGIKLTERYDLGVDIIAIKDGVRWGVQVKRYSGLVKAEAVRQVVTALNQYKCQRAMVVANNVFSRPAEILAQGNQCVLIDRNKLADWIVAFQQGK